MNYTARLIDRRIGGYDAGRNATLMRIYWNEDGTPNFSVPIPSGKGHDIPTEFTAKVIVK